MSCVALRLACLAAGVMAGAVPARADWLWFDDSRPALLRIEANGFTLAALAIESGGASHVLTNGTYGNRDLILPGATDVRFAGTFSLYYVPAATFVTTEFFLPPGGGTIPGAELVLNGTPEDGGEHVSGVFIGKGDPALPNSVPAGARAIVVNSDDTFPFSTQNLSMLVSLPGDRARVAEPAGFGVVGFGLLGLAWARRRMGFQPARHHYRIG